MVSDGRVVEVHEGNPLDFIEAYQRRFKVALRPGMPRFCGGLAGYFGYEAVRFMEPKLAHAMVPHLLAGADAWLLQPPPNVLRLSLHPLGLAPTIANLAQWRRHLLQRLHQQIQQTGDALQLALLKQLQACPAPTDGQPELQGEPLARIFHQ